MSLSVAFWRLPEEEQDLVSFLLTDPTVMATPNELVTSADQIVWKLLVETLRTEVTGFFIALPAFIPAMKLVHVESRGVRINILSAPALVYRRGTFWKPSRLLPTILQVNTSYVAEDRKTTIDLPSDYIRWGKRILQWARRSVPGTYRSKNYRITPKAEAARQAGMAMDW